MKIIHQIKVPQEIEPARLYDYCHGKLPQLPSRKSVKKSIDKGLVLVNDEPQGTGFWLTGGETIALIDPENTPPKTYHLNLEVLYEDEHLAAINKPAGLLTSGNAFKTVQNALLHNLTKSNAKDALEWPKPLHRLDKATSGILLIAKTKKAQMTITQQFEKKHIQKTYHAVVMGNLKGKGTIDEPIEGKEAITQYKTIKTVPSLRSGHLTLVELKPLTGRTHQLRIHLSKMGNAILGDPLYSPPERYLKYKGLFLCANSISFSHPTSNQNIYLNIELPKKFLKRLENEEKRWMKRNLSNG